MEGTVVRVMSDKGFGFIRYGKEDYFFHKTDFEGFFDDLVEDLHHKQTIKVSFEVVESPRGPRASNVRRLDGGVNT